MWTKVKSAGVGLKSTLAAAGFVVFATAAHASFIPIGSSLTFGGNDLPGDCTNTSCSDTVTFSSTPVLIDGGALSLYETQTATGANGEWDVWHVSTVGGGPIAGDTSGYWSIVLSYTLSANVIFDAVVDQWTVNGTAVTPTGNIGGICCASASNPILPGGGFYSSGFSGALSAGVQSNWEQIYVSPYSFVSSGGIDPDTANGFNFALHFTAATVPEPSTWAMLLLGFAGLGFAGYRAQRKTAALAA
jgi:hypothetical protein